MCDNKKSSRDKQCSGKSRQSDGHNHTVREQSKIKRDLEK